MCLSYPNSGAEVLHDVSIDLPSGRVVALVGENGAGKTSAIRALMGLVGTDSGTVRVEGRAPRLSDFGFLFQDYGRFELSVRQYVTLGVAGDPTSRQIFEALRMAHVDAFVSQLDGGLDAQLGEQWHGRTISGGEWQRLALARVFLRNARVWILDEPTSSVDAVTESDVFARLAERSAGHSTLVVTHRASTLRLVDRIDVMKQGRIVQSGSYDALRRSPGEFQRLFRQQS